MKTKNDDRPFDAALFPEGMERCSLRRFLLHLVPVVAFGLWGVYASYFILGQGLEVTALDNYFGFGFWIGVDLAFIALGAGAFFSGVLRYLLNITKLKNLVNLAVIVGFLCYSGAMMILTLDIGQPLRAWFGYWHANVHSMLTEVIFCISVYCAVLLIEYIPLIIENRQVRKIKILRYIAHNLHLMMPLFAGVGTFLSTFHQGSLGGMYGVLFARPYVYRDGFFIWPWTFFLFVLSAIGSGPMFMVLVATFMEKLTGRKLMSWDVKQLMGKISGVMFSIYMLFKLIDTTVWVFNLLPRAGMTFDQMFHGWIYGRWLFVTEVVICGIIPAYFLARETYRSRPVFFYTSSLLACISVVINRYVMTAQNLALPVLPFDRWETYSPNWYEWAALGMLLAYGWIILAFSYRYLPIFPEEKKLNAR